jgi:hypothetical protein
MAVGRVVRRGVAGKMHAVDVERVHIEVAVGVGRAAPGVVDEMDRYRVGAGTDKVEEGEVLTSPRVVGDGDAFRAQDIGPIDVDRELRIGLYRRRSRCR